MNLAIALRYLAWNVSQKEEKLLLNHEMLNLLSAVVLRCSNHDSATDVTHTIPFKQCSKWYFLRGKQLLSAYTKHSDAYHLWMKTCKRYFKSALGIQDEYSESIYKASHVYLAALYYAQGTNQGKSFEALFDDKTFAVFREIETYVF